MSDEQRKDGEFQGTVLQSLKNIEESLQRKVDQQEFIPVKNLVYGLVGLILVSVFTALIATVVKAVSPF